MFFLRLPLFVLLWFTCLTGCLPKYAKQGKDTIVTVTGPKPNKEMGISLIHEHVLVDFIGAAQVSKTRYNSDEVFATVLPHLQKIKALGCETLVECTPAYLGRDAALLKRLSEASNLNIITNTGFYGAGKGKYLPAFAFTETAEQLARRWMLEWKQGIDGTGIKPGFMKISVDAGKLSDVNRKLVKAAALTHLQTGLTIASHTGNGEAALEELAVIKESGVSPEAFIWVHAQNEKDINIHLQAAKAGSWISFDGIGPKNIDQYIERLNKLKQAGFLNRILISQDAGWYHVGEPGGGNFRTYETIFTQFIPALKQAGFSEAAINQVLIHNPKEAFTIKIRK